MILLQTWKLNCWPPSVNRLQRYPTAQYKAFKIKALIELKKGGKTDLGGLERAPLELHLDFHSDGWWCLDGRLKKRLDLDNLIKPTIDSIFNYLNVDDGRVVKLFASKQKQKAAEKERYIMATLYAVEDSEIRTV